MEKTWIRFLLPDDEYKRRNMLVYFAEAAILQLIAMIVLLVTSRLKPSLIDSEIALLCLLFGTIAYIWIRYILSGMEFAEIMTEKAYRREKKQVMVKSLTYFLVFNGLILLYYALGKMSESLIEGLIVSSAGALLLFVTNFISLRRSYQKNRELID
ncbi:hypothetical protein [Terribacillus saccharophilus]|uniref:hypothetical protein n=1 Tax=Terribacillus saccharophilus TaxID=361277 RepID=UPI002989AD70|nr:hypothetical protein [Terribacillus saccharophilus]MCM3226964.1 hypothetical protein [Terribacillus saccharophilus]